jgi:hypothetical protein
MSPSDILMAVLICGPWLIPAVRLMRVGRRVSESVSRPAVPVQTEPVRARDQIWVTPQRASWLTRNRVS